MKKIYTHVIILLLSIALTNKVIAQQSKPAYQQTYLGIGAGFDYGGIGLKAEFLPVKWLGIFGGAGYNLVENLVWKQFGIFKYFHQIPHRFFSNPFIR